MEDVEPILILDVVDDEGHGPAGIQQVLAILCIMVAGCDQVIRIPHTLLLDVLAELCVAQKIAAGPVEEAEDRQKDDDVGLVTLDCLECCIKEGLDSRIALVLGDGMAPGKILQYLVLLLCVRILAVATAAEGIAVVPVEVLIILPAGLEEIVVADVVRIDVLSQKNAADYADSLLLLEARRAVVLDGDGGHLEWVLVYACVGVCAD